MIENLKMYGIFGLLIAIIITVSYYKSRVEILEHDLKSKEQKLSQCQSSISNQNASIKQWKSIADEREKKIMQVEKNIKKKSQEETEQEEILEKIKVPTDCTDAMKLLAYESKKIGKDEE